MNFLQEINMGSDVASGAVEWDKSNYKSLIKGNGRKHMYNTIIVHLNVSSKYINRIYTY